MKKALIAWAVLFPSTPLLAQHVVPEASDEFDYTAHDQPYRPQGDGPDIPSWRSAGTTFFNRSRVGGEWTGTGLGAEFHIFGGELFFTQWGTKRTNVVETWSYATQTWRANTATMPIPVSNISGSCEVKNGVIYVFGGYDINDMPIANIQAFDGTTFVDTGATLSEAAWGVGAMNDVNGDIIAFGGFGIGTGSSKASTDIFTPPASVNPGVPMPGNLYMTTGDYNVRARTSHAVGGFAQEQTHYIWDGSTWSVAASPAQERGGCGMASAKKFVACIGGDISGWRDDQEVYDTTSGNWTSFTSVGTMNQGRRTFAHGIVFSSIFPGKFNFMAANGWAGSAPVRPLNDAEQIL